MRAWGELHHCNPLCRWHPPCTHHTLLVVSVPLLWNSTAKSVYEIVGDKKWVPYLPEPVCLVTWVTLVETTRLHGLSDSSLSDEPREPRVGGCARFFHLHVSHCSVCSAPSCLRARWNCVNASQIPLQWKDASRKSVQGNAKAPRRTLVDLENCENDFRLNFCCSGEQVTR